MSLPVNKNAPKAAGLYELGPLNVVHYEMVPRPSNHFEERTLRFDPLTLEQPDGTDFHGYFQCWQYLEGLPESFRGELELREPWSTERSRVLAMFRKPGRRLIAVNVRRGDYLNANGYHLVLPAEYYLRAIGRLRDGKTDFVVISDGLDWCRENIAGPDVDYLVPSSHWQSFGFMCRCDGMIGSASSFSWWAAWLQGNAPKIFPDRWYGQNGPDYSIDDILPPGWERMPA